VSSALGDERDPDFRRLWAAQTISMAGTAVTDVAMPLTLVGMGATSFEFGVLFALKSGPRLFALVFAAPLADRLPRKPLLIACDLVRCVALATLPLAALFGVLGKLQLYAVSFLLGLGDVTATTASRAYLPSLVRTDALVACNGRLEAGTRISSSVVPGLAGLLIKLVAAPFTIAIDCLSYLVSATLLSRIRRIEPPPPASTARGLRAGLATILGDPVLRAVVLSLGAMNLGVALLYAQLAHYFTDDLAFTPILVGIGFAMFSLGGLVGSIVRVGSAGRGHLVLGTSIAICAAGAAVLAGAATGGRSLIALLGAFLVGLGSTLFMVHNVTMRQVLSPAGMHGRVNAAAIMLGPGLAPVGALAGGKIATQLGLREMFLATAAYMALTAVAVVVSPLRRFVGNPPPDAGEPRYPR
jgi:MFS family permease